MFELISTYKYGLLITAEVIFWTSLISFLVIRYWFRLSKISLFFIPVIIINELFLAFIAYIDFQNTGKFSSFQTLILVIVIYSLTYGKKDFRLLDLFIQRQVAQWRGETLPEELPKEVPLYGWEHAKNELKAWLTHLFFYIGFLLIIAILFEFTFEHLSSIPQAFEKGTLLKNEIANGFLLLWTLIFVIDTVITFSYVLFPKKKS